MRYVIILLLSFTFLFASCRHHDGPTNEYKNAKVHESDKIANERKKLNRKAKKQGQKTMKAARKAQRKKQRGWFKKGSYE